MNKIVQRFYETPEGLSSGSNKRKVLHFRFKKDLILYLNSSRAAIRKGIFDKQQRDSNLKEHQLGIDKGCFFRIWEKPIAIQKPFEAVNSSSALQ